MTLNDNQGKCEAWALEPKTNSILCSPEPLTCLLWPQAALPGKQRNEVRKEQVLMWKMDFGEEKKKVVMEEFYS